MTNKLNSFRGSSLPHTMGTCSRRLTALQLYTFQPSTEVWLVLRQYILFHLFLNPDMLWRSGTSSYKCKAPEMRNWSKKKKKPYFLQVSWPQKHSFEIRILTSSRVRKASLLLYYRKILFEKQPTPVKYTGYILVHIKQYFFHVNTFPFFVGGKKDN